ncbi:MAG: hypothetical protein ACD_46C00563G0005 [uncultured bacterium]|nr:MAG: hypothetical protein ACD_46C00563G0005 [uncultured bacterium]
MRIGIIKNKLKPASPFKWLQNKLTADFHLTQNDILVFPTSNYAEGIKATNTALNEGCDIIVAAGGDGTVLSIINALVDSSAKLLIFPQGTSNDIAKSLNIYSIDDAYAALKNNKTTACPLLLCHYRDESHNKAKAYAYNMGAGMSAEILAHERIKAFQTIRKFTGDTVFSILAFTHVLFTHQANEVVLEIDGQSINNQKLVTIECCKTKKIGDFHISPYADIQKQQAPVTLISCISFMQTLKTFYKLMRHSTLLSTPGLEYFGMNNTNSVNLNQKIIFTLDTANIPIHLNGEYLGTSPCSCELCEKTITVFSNMEQQDA